MTAHTLCQLHHMHWCTHHDVRCAMLSCTSLARLLHCVSKAGTAREVEVVSGLTVHAEACACPSGHVHEFHTSVHVPSLRIYLACQELISTMSDQLCCSSGAMT